MHLSEEFKVYWFTPQRNGTRSTKQFLESLGFRTVFHQFFFDSEKENYFFICNVRNPYSRLVSIFGLNSHHEKNFKRDFKQWTFEKFKSDIFLETYKVNYHKKILELNRPFNKFVRLENLKDDILSLHFVDLNNEKVKESFENSIIHNSYKNEFEEEMDEKNIKWFEFYDTEVADFVYNELEEQFILFNYKKNSWIDGTP